MTSQNCTWNTDVQLLDECLDMWFKRAKCAENKSEAIALRNWIAAEKPSIETIVNDESIARRFMVFFNNFEDADVSIMCQLGLIESMIREKHGWMNFDPTGAKFVNQIFITKELIAGDHIVMRYESSDHVYDWHHGIYIGIRDNKNIIVIDMMPTSKNVLEKTLEDFMAPEFNIGLYRYRPEIDTAEHRELVLQRAKAASEFLTIFNKDCIKLSSLKVIVKTL